MAKSDVRFFVMLNHPNGTLVPMTTGDADDVAMYPSAEKAKAAAWSSTLGEHFGFEVFERGAGESM